MILKEVCNIYLGHGLLKKNLKFKIFEAEGQKNIPFINSRPFFYYLKKMI